MPDNQISIRPEFLSVTDISKRWGNVPTCVIYEYIHFGRLKAAKLGRSWRVKISDLERFEREKQKLDEEELRNLRLCLPSKRGRPAII